MDQLAHKTNHLTYFPPTPVGPPPRVLTVRQFHSAIGGAIGLNSLYALVRSGRIKSVRVGRKHLILGSEIAEFFDREANSN